METNTSHRPILHGLVFLVEVRAVASKHVAVPVHNGTLAPKRWLELSAHLNALEESYIDYVLVIAAYLVAPSDLYMRESVFLAALAVLVKPL